MVGRARLRRHRLVGLERGQGLDRAHRHGLIDGDGPERIYGEWWRRDGEIDAVRDYFRVEDEMGGRYWLFRRGDGVDPRTGDLSWHMHGIFG